MRKPGHSPGASGCARTERFLARVPHHPVLRAWVLTFRRSRSFERIYCSVNNKHWLTFVLPILDWLDSESRSPSIRSFLVPFVFLCFQALTHSSSDHASSPELTSVFLLLPSLLHLRKKCEFPILCFLALTHFLFTLFAKSDSPSPIFSVACTLFAKKKGRGTPSPDFRIPRASDTIPRRGLVAIPNHSWRVPASPKVPIALSTSTRSLDEICPAV